MARTRERPAPPTLSLRATTAEELMTENPISIRQDAGVREAVALLTDRGFTAAPVTGENGEHVGVVSLTDIMIHIREYSRHLKAGTAAPGESSQQVGDSSDPMAVADIMTPVILTVERDTTATEVVRRLLGHGVHHLFVCDGEGTLIGVISTGDILRNLS